MNFWWPILGWWRGAEALIRGEFGVACSGRGGCRRRWHCGGFAQPRTRAKLPEQCAPDVAGHRHVRAWSCCVRCRACNVLLADRNGNRALAAAAPGVALILVAAVRFVGGLVNAQRRSLFFRRRVAAIAFFGTLRVLQIEEYWTQAPAIEQRTFAAARRDLRDVPPQSFVMLDNVCPYHGPAVIFEAPWDVSGALSLAAGKTDPRRCHQFADVASPRRAGDVDLWRAGLLSVRPNLYVYDPRRAGSWSWRRRHRSTLFQRRRMPHGRSVRRVMSDMEC